ncbi:transposase [Krasilnikovia cinnamomea]|uniref:Transposase n=1 Tax=Krasilnikovia cinnamomea TaxID=349313 RepID=A0A4Q7ZL64_9ACTN|nr:IS5 family transposase [Krasilnikovia cinnamomea]RZU51324.1 transposase [Krasilnikovia cinnamomea]
MATLAVTRRHGLRDAQWAVRAPLLPAPRTGRPPKWTKRQLIDGIRWRIRVGAPWRDVPEQYAPWQTIYGLFRRWQRDGTWARLLAALQAHADAAERIDWDVSVDSTVSRAHQHAAGARQAGHAQKEPPGGVQAEPADHALGRSRGGLTTKTHLACEQGQKPLSLVLTAGQRGDSPQFTAVLDKISVARLGAGRPRTRPDRVLMSDRRHVWAGSAGNDPVSKPEVAGKYVMGLPIVGTWLSEAYADGHGMSPHEAEFGANQYVVDTSGHSDYWNNGSKSLANQAAVVVGQYSYAGLEHGQAPPNIS